MQQRSELGRASSSRLWQIARVGLFKNFVSSMVLCSILGVGLDAHPQVHNQVQAFRGETGYLSGSPRLGSAEIFASPSLEEFQETPTQPYLLGWSLNPVEKNIARSYPLSFFRFVIIAYSIHRLVIQLCELQSTSAVSELEGDEESDALRHFLVAGIAAVELGQEFAELVLTAHEGPIDQLTSSGRMDLANNQIGYEMASVLASTSLREKVLRGIELLRQGRLVRMKNGRNQCSRMVNDPADDYQLKVYKFFNPEELSIDRTLL